MKAYIPDGKPSRKSNAETCACEYALGGSSRDVWLDNGKYFQWIMPWRETTYMGVRSSVAVTNHKDLENDKPNECGPAIKINYEDGFGMLTGTSLHILLYDPAWIISDFKKLEAADAKQGARNLGL